MMKIIMTQTLNDNGRLGAWLFIVSPVVGGACYAWLVSELQHRLSSNLWLAAGLVFLSGLAFLVGAVLVLIGRSYTAAVVPSEPAEETKGLWS
ncbi:hypothetical protein J2046_003005 [Rhizobium petrolearium]|uniref:hypothetical protein n=1 Tax=Neorhizobium petrolearium TaxID=515361 RepID=UPI001AE5FF2E|nr:hypothetical protein [Neorhizobium petrolearium]MBP1844738.1 hypothetical protein [Neorhizobium petrolearium]